MPETPREEIDPEESEFETPENISQTEENGEPRSYESLWGALLFAFLILFVVVSVVSVGWGMYTKWKSERDARAQLSITTLQNQVDVKQDTSDQTQGAGSDQEKRGAEASAGENTDTAKKVALSVLNGGSPKGSASTVVTFLKQGGYTNVTAGNTVQNYTGVVIYYAASLGKEAETIKTTLIQKFPQTKALPADPKNKETSVSPITIILGK